MEEEYKSLVWRVIKHINILSEDDEYFGSEDYTNNEIDVYSSAIKLGAVDQDWYDRRLKYNEIELCGELLFVLGMHLMYKQAETELQK
jgi:hypothetical protein